MSELRFNPLTGEWVIVAVERATRPESFSQKEVEKVAPKASCPFCMGQEAMTPPEVYALGTEGRQPNTPDWKIRVVPNKFPALGRDIIPGPTFLDQGRDSLISMGIGYGGHEVIISSPAHDKSIGQLDQQQAEHIVQTYQRRYRVLAKDKLIKYIQIICNHGKVAGASLEHPHSQIFGLPFVPHTIELEIQRCLDYFKQNKRTLLTDVLKDAAERKLVIYENEDFVVFEPFWAKIPFETYLVPRNPYPGFDELSDAALVSFTKALRMMLQKLYLKLGNPPYNFYLHVLPVAEGEVAKDKIAKTGFHWHVECVPRLSTQAGLEYGSGVFINTMVAEKAAEFLRS